MIKNPKISVLMPVYNGERFLKEAIDSVINQTYKNIEIIVINDGSTDSTEKIILSYGEKIKYIKKENGGVSSALNEGIKNSTGDYIAWLSHDDLFEENKLEIQVDYLNKIDKSTVILFTDFVTIDEDGNLYNEIRYHIDPSRSFREELISKSPVHGCTILIPKISFIEVGYFNEDLLTTQDFDMWFRLANRFKFYHIPVVTVKSRIHPDQTSWRLRHECEREADELYIRFVREISFDEINKYNKDYIAIYFLLMAIFLKKKGANKAAKYTIVYFKKYLTYIKLRKVLQILILSLYYISYSKFVYRIEWLLTMNDKKKERIKNKLKKMVYLKS